MTTYRITSWATGAAQPTQTAVSVDVLVNELPGSITRRYPYEFMVEGRYDVGGAALDAAVKAVLIDAGLIPQPPEVTE